MSNFPISEFHSPIPPRTPPFGVKLGLERLEFQRIGTGQGYKVGALKQFGSALFNAARQTLDDDFLYNNPDYKKLITYINTAGHHWLNFSPSPAEQVNLFLRGVAAGAVFLSHFNWEEYKRVREHLYRAQVADGGVQADTAPEVDRGSPDGNGSEEEEPLRMPTRVPSALGEHLPPPTSH